MGDQLIYYDTLIRGATVLAYLALLNPVPSSKPKVEPHGTLREENGKMCKHLRKDFRILIWYHFGILPRQIFLTRDIYACIQYGIEFLDRSRRGQDGERGERRCENVRRHEQHHALHRAV